MLPLSAKQIKADYAGAMKLMGAGKLDAAEKRFLMLLKAAPKLAEVHFQLGQIARARGNAAQAARHFADARQIKPREPAIWQALAETIAEHGSDKQKSGLLNEARRSGLPPKLLAALERKLMPPAGGRKPWIGSVRPQDIQKAVSLLDSGKAAEAERLSAQLLKAHPDVAVLALLLANSQYAQGKNAAAEANFRKALSLDPNYAEAHHSYGRFLVAAGRNKAAVPHLRRAISLAPDLPKVHHSLGIALNRLGDSQGAIAEFRRAIEQNEKSAEAHIALGKLLTTSGSPQEAAKVYEHAISVGLDGADILALKAESEGRIGHEDAAMAGFEEALKKDPENGAIYGLRGMLHQTAGRFDEAEADVRRAIELDPTCGEHYRTLLMSAKLSADDPLIAQMEEVYADPSLSDPNRMQLGFALANAMEQIGRYDQVFRYLDTANALWRKRYPYDVSDRRAEIDRVKRAFDTIDFSKKKPIEGATEFAPIFVTGMPRSGTTLVEQILASHSSVEGAGELGSINRTMLKTFFGHGAPEDMSAALTDEFFRDLGHEAEEKLRAACPGAERVTDKAIQTDLFLGAVKLAMPNARVVVVRRDPRDTLISIYKNVFAEGTHRYAYNQRDLGLYYRMYLETIDYWREKLPGGFYEIHYEDLIANPEEESRKLLQACDLEWEDQCLDFHKNKRKVSTLSLAQVRKPIYKTSKAAWKRYEADIGELLDALGDAVEG